jgi:hypothetical protein
VKREQRERIHVQYRWMLSETWHPNDDMTFEFDRAIFLRCGAEYPCTEIHNADMLMQRLEARLLLDVPESEILDHFGPVPDYAAKMLARLPGTLGAMFCVLSPREAERDWWERYLELGGKE